MIVSDILQTDIDSIEITTNNETTIVPPQHAQTAIHSPSAEFVCMSHMSKWIILSG